VCKNQQVDHDILSKLKIAWEPPKIEEPPAPPNDNCNAPNSDDQYLKSIKLDVSTFDGCHNAQFFLY